ncbi:hypothetical protein ACQ4PT_006227 [Festuca glaucescens]
MGPCGAMGRAKENAAAAVLNLASVHTYRRRLGQNASVVEKLVQLARANPASTRKDALLALLSLAGEQENVERLVDAGVAPPARAAAHPREPLQLRRRPRRLLPVHRLQHRHP